jgi:hypothetical protein
MRQRLRCNLTYANVMVTILAFIVLGGMSYAASGGNFILGQSNSASSTTSLTRTGANAGKGLQVSNTSTTTGATALGLNVAAGHPPFTVNSGTKVANLNADKLDGIDSSGLVQGRGKLLSNRIAIAALANSETLLTIPGLGELNASCGSEAANFEVDWQNTSSSTIDVWQEVNGSWSHSVAGPSDSLIVVGDGVGNTESTLELGTGFVPPDRRIATVHVFGVRNAANTACDYQAQATAWSE